jgi:hypothetical protein
MSLSSLLGKLHIALFSEYYHIRPYQISNSVTHKKSHRIKCRSATQENGTTKLFYCTEHGQNPTHPTCYTTLINRADKAKGTSSSGLTKTKFRKSESSYKKKSVDHITVSTTEEKTNGHNKRTQDLSIQN